MGNLNDRDAPPLVSVCIPTFNRAVKLKRAVDHLLACSYPNLEIIISDNASADETEQICRQLCSEHPNIRYFRHPVNRGPSPNFDFARAQARGEYFLWHGDDDYLDRDFIAACVEVLERDRSLSLASGRGAYHYGDNVVSFRGNIIESPSRSGLARALHFVFCVEEASMFCGVYRTAAVKECVMPNCLSGDCTWLAQVLLAGRARILQHCHVYRELGSNTSVSFDRIVAVLGAPAWHARYPYIAGPNNVATYLAFRAHPFRHRSLLARLGVWLLFFGTAFAKQVILLLTPKLPYGKQLYRRIFLDD